MNLEEVKQLVAQKKGAALQRVILVVTRKSPPSSDYIRVNGVGRGYVCNAQQRVPHGPWEIVAQFEVRDLERYIARVETKR